MSEDLQKAYEATEEVYKRAKKNDKNATLTLIFGVAASGAISYFVPQSLDISVLALNLAFITSTFQRRINLKNLASKFEEETQDFGNEASTYLKDISDEMKKVTSAKPLIPIALIAPFVPFSFSDINPIEQFKNNKAGIFIAVATSLSPIMNFFVSISMMPNFSDAKKNANLQNMAIKAKDALKKDHSLDVLVPKM